MAEADPNIRMAPDDQNLSMKHLGSIHRSDLLDEFARLENSVNEKLAALHSKSAATACVTQRLAELGDIAKNSPLRFRHAARVLELVAEARDLIKLRNSIVHSIMFTDATRPGRIVWTFNNIGDERPKFGELNYSLDSANFKELIASVKRLTKHLIDQQLKESDGVTTNKKAAPKPTASAPTSPA